MSALTRLKHRITGHDLNLTEVGMSDCPSGCKVYRCATCGAERVIHSAIYGAVHRTT